MQMIRRNSMSDMDRFWSIMDQTAEGFPDENTQLERLERHLHALEIPDLIAFEHDFDRVLAELISEEIIDVADLCSACFTNDTLDYFCYRIVALGRDAHDAIRTDPDCIGVYLAQVPGYKGFAGFETIRYIPGEVHEVRTGQPIPVIDVDELNIPAIDYQRKTADELKALYPKTAAWAWDLDNPQGSPDIG